MVISLFITQRNHFFERISDVNDIQSLLTGSPMTMDVDYVPGRASADVLFDDGRVSDKGARALVMMPAGDEEEVDDDSLPARFV
jgi:hypothetical protein